MVGVHDVPRDKYILKTAVMKKDILYPLRRIHGRIFEMRRDRQAARELKNTFSKVDKNTAFFVLSPTHGNMGDHAIAEAVTQMLSASKVDYMEVTTAQLSLLRKFGYLSALDKHLILVNGGGNLGTLWPEIEKLFRGLIQKNPHASIVCLPNTIYYEQSKSGNRELEKSKRIYNAHPRLTLCAREKISCEFMRQIYRNVLLIPDMALSLNHCKEGHARSGCMLCLRADHEKTITAEAEAELVACVEELFGSHYWRSDMNIGTSVSLENRKSELEKKYEEFRSAGLVITDRLHGMIFAAITGTPCIVINSKSPKVKGCYEWIREMEYIQFADDIGQIPSLYQLIQKENYSYDNEKLLPFYEELKKTIHQEMHSASKNR